MLKVDKFVPTGTARTSARKVPEHVLYGPIAALFKQRGYHVRTNTKYGDVTSYNPHKDPVVSVEAKTDDARSALVRP